MTKYKDDILHKDIDSKLTTNSHDYPELKLDSSSIHFTGTEDSPEKMTIINTRWALEINYNKIYKQAFEAC